MQNVKEKIISTNNKRRGRPKKVEEQKQQEKEINNIPKKRGRPKKISLNTEPIDSNKTHDEDAKELELKKNKKRGRPKKTSLNAEPITSNKTHDEDAKELELKKNKKRGRPKKNQDAEKKQVTKQQSIKIKQETIIEPIGEQLDLFDFLENEIDNKQSSILDIISNEIVHPIRVIQIQGSTWRKIGMCPECNRLVCNSIQTTKCKCGAGLIWELD